MSRLFVLYCFTFIFYSATAQLGQVGLPRISTTNLVPKSPQAAELIKVNEFTMNSARGTPDISFTLYTASTGNLKIPISIRYDASGIKYDDVPSVVGLKWSLSASGEISRNINGRPDENYFFAHANTYTYDILSTWNRDTDSAQTFYKALSDNVYDLSQDEYSYSYSDNSGYFYFRNNKLWDSESPHTTKIEVDGFNTMNDFQITDASGNKAYFGNQVEESSNVIYAGNGGYASPNVPSDGTTAWKLHKLKAYTGEEAIFEYDTVSYYMEKVNSQAFVKRTDLNPDVNRYNCNCGTSSLSESIFMATYLIYVPKKITTPLEEITFWYSRDNGLSLFRKRLDSITVKDRTNQKIVSRFRFKYSKYNTANLLRLDEVWSVGANGDSLLVAGFHYTANALPGIASKSRDIFNYNNGVNNSYLISTSSTDVPIAFKGERGIYTPALITGILDTVYYPTGGKAAFFYSANKIGDTCAPGARVDSIKYYNMDNSVASSIGYSYAGLVDGYIMSGYVNNVEFDGYNAECPVLTYHSEFPFRPNGNGFFYEKVEIRKKGGAGIPPLLTKEWYTRNVNCYGKLTSPVLEKRAFYRDNNSADTIRVEQSTFYSALVDSLKIRWLYPGPSHLADRWYHLDGFVIDNSTTCNSLYSGVASYGYIQPYRQLLAKQTIKEFHETNSNSFRISTTSYTYNGFWQPVSEKKNNSDGSLDSMVHNYLYTNNDILTPSVKGNNLYGLTDKMTRYTDNNKQLSRSRVHFGVQPNGLILADTFYIQQLSTPEIVEKRVSAYDVRGQVTELEEKPGYYHAFIWSYESKLLAAHVTNARLSQVAYSSFENSEHGGWSLNGGSTVLNNGGVTGKKSLDGGVSKTIPAGNYMVSVWSTGNPWINGQQQTQTPIKILGAWRLYEVKLTNITSVTVSGSNIDEVRLYPAEAQMITYVYDPLIGMTYQCDARHTIAVYEYDGFNRLLRIRDDAGNILKQFDYQYQVPAHNNPVWQTTGQTRCKPCPANNSYTTNILQNEERDNNLNSPTYNQTRWTDAGTSSSCSIIPDWQNTTSNLRCAQANGVNTGYQEQEQRDMNPCSPTAGTTRWVSQSLNCTTCPIPENWQSTGVVRCVKNAFNENTGEQEREEANINACTTSYRWVSEGPNTANCPVCDITICKGNNKRCINNICTLGIKVYTSAVQDPFTLMWTCTYHYEWSNGTIWSEDYTEQSARECDVVN